MSNTSRKFVRNPFALYAVWFTLCQSLCMASPVGKVIITRGSPTDVDGDGITDLIVQTTANSQNSGAPGFGIILSSSQTAESFLLNPLSKSPRLKGAAAFADYDGDHITDFSLARVARKLVSLEVLSSAGSTLDSRAFRGNKPRLIVGCHLDDDLGAQFRGADLASFSGSTVFIHSVDGSIRKLSSPVRRGTVTCGDLTGDGIDELIFHGKLINSLRPPVNGGPILPTIKFRNSVVVLSANGELLSVLPARRKFKLVALDTDSDGRAEPMMYKRGMLRAVNSSATLVDMRALGKLARIFPAVFSGSKQRRASGLIAQNEAGEVFTLRFEDLSLTKTQILPDGKLIGAPEVLE